MGAVVEGAWSGLKGRLEEASQAQATRDGDDEELNSSTTATSTTPPPPLDFTTLQSLHSLYLSLLQSGLLLTHDELSNLLGGMVETSEKVCRVVKGWSGEALVGAELGGEEGEEGEFCSSRAPRSEEKLICFCLPQRSHRGAAGHCTRDDSSKSVVLRALSTGA